MLWKFPLVLRSILIAILIAAFAAVGLMTRDVARAANQPMLVSITGVTLGDMQFFFGLSGDMKNLRVLAICNVPPGWNMEAASPIGPTTDVEGGASGSVAALDNDRLKELQGLFLVKALDYGGPHDYEIDGSLSIEVRAEEPGWIDFPLQSSNIVVEPADRCPARTY